MKERKKRLGNKLKEGRKNKNLTQDILAEKLDLDKNTISTCEQGIGNFPVGKLKNLCSILEIDMDNFLDNNKVRIKENESLIEMMKHLLSLTDEISGEGFLNKYNLVQRGEIVLFPRKAVQDFEKNLHELISSNEKIYMEFCDYYRIYGKHSKVLDNLFEILLEDKKEFKKINILSNVTNDFDKHSEIIRDFYCFWGWTTQMLNLLIDDFTLKGIELIALPISNDEYTKYKSFYPRKPAEFIRSVLLSRGFEELLAEGQIESNANWSDFFNNRLENNGLDCYIKAHKEKHNSIEKVKYYF
ncbi:helix-turn-helix domain-containing protein [Listeria ivanovii]|uniref:helix-turn-helix domain-containing protein n=1 Tax=Listeria ivanovii TaxID=1638 RepID=UPI0015E8D921|nr:helix-turn-helix transcriptional regulator [Listeria ivanovii]